MVAQRRKTTGPHPAQAIDVAARECIARAIGAIPRLLRKAARVDPGSRGQDAPKSVHQLRVACRRAEAALDGYGDLSPRKPTSRLRKWLKRTRRAAGRPRDLDVLIETLSKHSRRLKPPCAKPARALARRSAVERVKAQAKLLEVADRYDKRRWTDALERLTSGIDAARVGETAVGKLARRVVRQAADAAIADGTRNLREIENLHALRLSLKKLRYRLDLFALCLPDHLSSRFRTELAEIQGTLGAAADAERMCAECENALSAGDDPSGALRELHDHYRAALERAIEDAVATWSLFSERGLFARIDQAFEAGGVRFTPERTRLPASQIETKPATSPVSPHGLNGQASELKAGRTKPQRRRLAAIDIGTNSIRLIIAEAVGDGTYRVLDDEKEITRLGRGLDASRRLDPAAIEHSAAAVARMKSIAEGYGAERIRVVATAAAREADNGADLLAAIHERSGVRVEIISADREAMLAYRSAATPLI